MKRVLLLAFILLTTACAKKSDSPEQVSLSGEAYHDIPFRFDTPVYRVTRLISETEIAFNYFYPETSAYYGTYNADYATIEQKNGLNYTLVFHNSDCHENGSRITFTVVSKSADRLVFTTNEIYPAQVSAAGLDNDIPEMPALDLASFIHSATCRL